MDHGAVDALSRSVRGTVVFGVDARRPGHLASIVTVLGDIPAWAQAFSVSGPPWPRPSPWKVDVTLIGVVFYEHEVLERIRRRLPPGLLD